MHTLTSLPLFTVSNHHGPAAGDPPSLNGDDPSQYHSYFENFSGEQAVFVYDWTTHQAVLWCGDAGWQAYPVRDGQVEELSPPEQLWLQACWQAVTGSKSR